MKLITLTLLLFFSIISFGQEIPKDPETGKYKYEEIIQVEGVSQTELFNKANVFCHNYDKKTTEIYFKFDMNDQKKESIGVNANLSLENKTNLYFNIILKYYMKILFKDGRCKLIINDLKLDYTKNVPNNDGTLAVHPVTGSATLEEGLPKSGLIGTKKINEKLLIEISEKLQKIISDIKSGIVYKEKDNW